ncbi:hypothetical protein BJ742DRAFT_95373 [Cladochytrium replicatum]|nr:hypothetical protein BJ742DRAFT_95373 [Cladochytrium replicatum]
MRNNFWLALLYLRSACHFFILCLLLWLFVRKFFGCLATKGQAVLGNTSSSKTDELELSLGCSCSHVRRRDKEHGTGMPPHLGQGLTLTNGDARLLAEVMAQFKDDFEHAFESYNNLTVPHRTSQRQQRSQDGRESS